MDSFTSERIVKTPGVCGGRACLAGHRVRVLDIVTWHEHQGLTADEIVSLVPSIADVHAAFAWYFEHVKEIQAEMREERAIVDEAHPSGCFPMCRSGFTWTNTFPAVSWPVFAAVALT